MSSTPTQPIVLGGVGVIGSSPTSVQDFQISFPSPSPFGTATPFVVATAFQDPFYEPSNLSDTFAVTITDVEPTGFMINVVRVDVPGGWGQNLQVIWVAVEDVGATRPARSAT